jgi:hypothetical protein
LKENEGNFNDNELNIEDNGGNEQNIEVTEENQNKI